ncbi:MAG: VanZ family protein, partial [Chloroflexota bacterium]|nr:VanZ family protein [Chloroflexota bacterium]
IRTDADRSGQPRRGLYLRNIVFLWGPALAWMGAIFYVSSVNTWTVTPKVPEWQGLRKLAHIGEYALLALLVGRALLGTWTAMGASLTRALLRRVWVWGAIISGLYAVSDEVHQSFVPLRELHWEDVTIDALAGIAALGIWYIVYVELSRRRARQRAQVAVQRKSG